MTADRQKHNTVLFLGVLLAAGICNLFTGTSRLFFNTLMFCMNFTLDAGLLLFWLQSVRERLLPTKTRSYITAAAILMIAYLLLRVIKYRVTLNAPVPSRYAVYAYWTPQILIPTLFLMLCVDIRRGGRKSGQWDERLLLIPACALALLVLTNDLHMLVYRPKVEPAVFALATGSYTLGPGFYLLYGWMGATAASGLVLLALETGKRSMKALVPLLGLIALWFFLIQFCAQVLERRHLPHLFFTPEIHIFCMLGFFEICIRQRLIPYNENTVGFFSQLDLPVLITDRALRPVYRTALPVEASGEQLVAALKDPLYPQEHLRLSGMEIDGGYAFWTEDESELHRELDRLASATELLSEENDLIAVENSLKEKQAQLDAQGRVYDRIAAALYPKQKRVEELLKATQPGTEGFPKALAECGVLNAWSKRKSNLLLLKEEELPKRNRELFLAVQDSARFLKCCGVEAAAVGEEYSELPLSAVHRLYDSFETVLEAWLPCLRRMTVSLADDGLRLAIEAEGQPGLPQTELPIARRDSEGYVFLSIRVPEGGEAA